MTDTNSIHGDDIGMETQGSTQNDQLHKEDGQDDSTRDVSDTDGRTKLNTMLRVVNWNMKRKSSRGQLNNENIQQDGIKTDDRKLGKPPDITRENPAGPRRGSVKPGRKSLGAIWKEHDRSKTAAQLLSEAMKHDVERLTKKFRFLIRLRVLLYRWWKRHSMTEVSSSHPFYMQYQMINDLSENSSGSAIDFKASHFKANKQMRMSQEAIRILTMPPQKRSKDEIYYAMIALRSVDSIADYPLRMQEALATYGMFQNYGPKRIIVKQGHMPTWFYFILFGTVVVATLESGEPYAKTRVTLRRGENFGELAIARRLHRQSTVLTMEYCEFLTIDCDTYENIFMAGGVKTIHDPDHNKFMRSLFFLKDWPLEILQHNPKAMEFCYFKRNTVMVHDSNASGWIYIVKSGSLKVYKMLQKCYSTVNKKTGNYTIKAHTDGFHSFLSQKSEYNRYATYNNLDLPTPLGGSDSEDDSPTEGKVNVDDKENLLSLPLLQRVERLIRPRTATGGVIATYGQSTTTTKRNVQTAMGMYKDMTSPLDLDECPASANTSIPNKNGNVVNFQSNIGKRTLVNDFEASANNTSKKDLSAAQLNPEFALIQTLTKGQAFGIQQVFIENQPSLILVSAGAEVVMLNKKVYKEHMDPNLVQQLKAEVTPFPSDEELQHNLQVRVNWMEYRKITLKNLLTEKRDRHYLTALQQKRGIRGQHKRK